jgi:hypothetical protein
VALALAGEPHECPHDPQLATSSGRCTSQPSVGTVLQSAKPARHANPHVLAAHAGLACGLGEQLIEHAPQFVGSVVVSTHTPLQTECGGAQHTPLMHISPAVVLHAFPHEPQFIASVWKLRQIPAHAVVPVGHTHAPLTQLAPVAHAMPHALQLFGSVNRSWHELLHEV